MGSNLLFAASGYSGSSSNRELYLSDGTALGTQLLKDIIAVKPSTEYRLLIRYEDGVEGEIDLSKILRFTGVFEPLLQKNFFAKVYVDQELGTICWPNGADLDPDVLYSVISGQPIFQFEAA